MKFEEPKVEFVAIDTEDIVCTSPGQETHMCSGSSYQQDPDSCSADPSLF